MAILTKVTDKPYLVDSQDVYLVYQALLHYSDSLTQMAKWFDNNPENQNAINNIREEALAYSNLSLDMYTKFFNRAVNEKFVERNREPYDHQKEGKV